MTNNLEILLKKTVEVIEKEIDLSHITSGEKFETYVWEKMCEIAKGDSSLPQKVEQTGKLAFPDIVVEDTWGVEVKYSNSGKWDSLGNSIFESTSIEGLKEILVLFGRKNGNKIEVKFDLYENCVTDVKVTHSPRFIINMNDNNDSLFKELNIKYNDFKNLDKSLKGKQIKDYFKSNLKPGDEVWWIDQEETATLPKLRTFNNLSRYEQNQLMIEAFILFPEVLSNAKRTKYNRVAPYWLTKYQVYNSSLRDKFSASGKEEISIPPIGHITVSQVYENLHELSKDIKDYLDNPQDQFLETIKEKWGELGIRITQIEGNNLVDVWSKLIDNYGIPPYKNVLPSDVFKAGLLK
ncbi:hypothetical protein QUF81_00125 [Peribacillus simplex]|uniref:hypothetical protein n=1 Tax=Peribacillus simplex TaxID=1478 RepID=UPI0025A0FB48|nr:hypothetical protein [Peribacillus simplex]MDM5291709.1 hypothetical protein [Peribacillus simplex]